MSDDIYESREAVFTAFCGHTDVNKMKRRSIQITKKNMIHEYLTLDEDEIKELIKALLKEYVIKEGWMT